MTSLMNCSAPKYCSRVPGFFWSTACAIAMHQVRFAEPRRAVDEQRVVRLARGLSDACAAAAASSFDFPMTNVWKCSAR